MQLSVFLAIVANVVGVPTHHYDNPGVHVYVDIPAEPYVHIEPIETHHIDEDITAEPYVHFDPDQPEGITVEPITEEPITVEPYVHIDPFFGFDPEQSYLLPGIVSVSNDKFSTKLYDLLRRKHQNLVFSPFSISVVMAMLSAGARGETLKQIKKGLFLPPSPTLQAEYKNILPTIRSTKDFTIETANKVFVKKGFSIKRDFQEILRNSFHSNIQDLDFGDSEEAADEINDWVEERTRDKIEDLIKPGMIGQDTSLVLVNAIYFKSNWAKKFDTTDKTQFHTGPYNSLEVPMMWKSEEVFHASLGTLASTMVELPYKGGRIVMQVLLPETKSGLEDLEEKLKNVDIQELFEREKEKTEVVIGLPKFKQENMMQLNVDLWTLGVKNMFFQGRADFSGITDDEELYVSNVVQKAFIEVDEEGTEASAATVAVVGTESAGPVPPLFLADHPFIFYLRDKETGLLLFQGRVVNPLK